MTLTIRRTPIIALVILIALTPLGLAASGSYVGGPGDLFVICDAEEATGLCLGGHVFDIPDTASFATIEIHDEVTEPTAGYYIFQHPDGQNPYQGPFCDSTIQGVPSTDAQLEVYVSGVRGPLDCPAPGTATTGDITVDFS